jgi:hypothetical protein
LAPVRVADLVADTLAALFGDADLVAGALAAPARVADLVVAVPLTVALDDVDLAARAFVPGFAGATFAAVALDAVLRATAFAGAAFFGGLSLLAAEVAFFTAMLGPLQDGASSSPQNTYVCA